MDGSIGSTPVRFKRLSNRWNVYLEGIHVGLLYDYGPVHIFDTCGVSESEQALIEVACGQLRGVSSVAALECKAIGGADE